MNVASRQNYFAGSFPRFHFAGTSPQRGNWRRMTSLVSVRGVQAHPQIPLGLHWDSFLHVPEFQPR